MIRAFILAAQLARDLVGETQGKDYFHDDGKADIDLCARPAILADAGASSD
jgi:hypothetical protein